MRARTFDSLVDEHVRRWEMEQQTVRRSAPPLCIALSRLPRSGGAELGSRVATELGYEFFGRELVDYVAREHRVQRKLVATLDERTRSLIDRYADAFRMGAFTESDYLRHIIRAVTTIGHRGNAVLLGRGSAYILEPERTLRVLVVAPRAHRAERLASSEGISQAEATRLLPKLDDERREFLAAFVVEPDDPTLYDLVVNTGTLGMEAAVSQVCAALESRRP